MDAMQTAESCEVTCTVGGDLDRKILKAVRKFFRKQINAGMDIVRYAVEKIERFGGKYFRVEIAAVLAPHET